MESERDSEAPDSTSAVVHEVPRGDLSPAPGEPGRRGRAGAVVLLGWGAAMLFLGAIMMGRHELALPVPQPTDPVLASSLASLREDPAHPLAVHVLYTECRCSQKIAVHLLSSQRPAGIQEAVLLVGKDPALASRLRARGFGVRETTEPELFTRYHVPSAPMFVLLTPAGEVRYAGGYTRTKQGADPQDLEILSRAQTQVVEALPVVGCAVEKSLRAQVDPTGLL
jgi:hypothetical protein